jgi:hypothetical protein
MWPVSPLDLATLGARLAFVVLLYVVVVCALIAMRRELARAGEAQERPLSARAAPPRAALTLVAAASDDGPPGRMLPLEHTLVVGRRASCDVILHDDAVSGQHARFSHNGRQWRVEDLGSTNGTLVNGTRIRAAHELRPGDLVATGTAVWRFDMAR